MIRNKITIFLKFILPVLLAYIIHTYASGESQIVMFSISKLIQKVLIFVLPFIIFSSMSRSIRMFSYQSLTLILIILVFIIISNFIHVVLSSIVTNVIIGNADIIEGGGTLLDFSELSLRWDYIPSPIISNSNSLILGFIVGFISIVLKNDIVSSCIDYFNNFIDKLFVKIFTPIMPIMLCGLVLNLIHTGVFNILLIDHRYIFLYMLIAVFIAINMYILIAAFLSGHSYLHIMKNILPAYFTAIATMSSGVTLPFSIIASTANTKDKAFSSLFLTSTVNIHLIGDSLCIPILNLIILHIFNIDYDFFSLILFACGFVIFKFSGAGVPGGTILVMLPLLQEVFHYDEIMSSTIFSMYVLMDSIITSTSVACNNAFTVIWYHIYNSKYLNSQVSAVKQYCIKAI